MTKDPASALSGRRILVVEDERLLALDVQSILQGWGCTVVGPVGTVTEALSLIANDPPDCAVLNVHLNDGTSEPVAAALRASERPFLALTAYEGRHLTGALVNASLLSKPLNERKLRRALHALVSDSARG